MAQYDLCTLSDVKAWLGRSDANSDALLQALITRTSRQILSWLRRGTILPHTVSEVRDGTGGTSIMLREWPVLSVSSLAIDGQIVPQATSSVSRGFVFEPWNGMPPGGAQVLALRGFCYGFRLPGVLNTQIVAIAYRAGYQASAEAQSVANGSVTVIAPCGAWASNGGVMYANGTPLVAVNGAPAAGQYQLDANAPGSYIFNAADNRATVLITYGY